MQNPPPVVWGGGRVSLSVECGTCAVRCLWEGHLGDHLAFILDGSETMSAHGALTCSDTPF